jgi:NRPS condensation-like uncharacterized protein
MISRIPRRLPAEAQDRMIYGCRFGQHEHANFALSFGGRLDEQRLAAAMRLAMDAEPVFGCRFVPGKKPYWQRRGDLDTLALCSLAPTADFARELDRFVASPCDGTRDPLLTACIVRGETDALLLKTSHLAVDGVGCKQLLSLIASLYRNPRQGVVPNLGCRSARQLFRQIGWLECLRILRQPLRRRALDQWHFPSTGSLDQGNLRFAIRRLEPAAFDTLYAAGKRFDATLNEVFVAACFRAIWRFLDFPTGVPQSITIPTNLRPYLRSGATEAICNFVAPLHATIARIADEPFERTLIRVKNCPLREPVRRERAVAAMFWISVLTKLPLRRMKRRLKPVLEKPPQEVSSVIGVTNLGAFEPDQFDFGVPLTDMYRISQAAFAPGLLMTVSSFRKKLTFSINYPGLAIRPEDIERFLGTFIEELSQAIAEEPVSASAAPISSPATPERARPALHLPNTK